MKKLVIDFDEAVETLKRHYNVSEVEIVMLPVKRKETPPAKMKGQVRASKEFWDFGGCFTPEGKLKTEAMEAINLLRKLYHAAGESAPVMSVMWVNNPVEVLGFIYHVDVYNKLPVL